MFIIIGGFEIKIVVAVCSECGFEGECRSISCGLVCETCIEEPLV